jgi:hypothetical protein
MTIKRVELSGEFAFEDLQLIHDTLKIIERHHPNRVYHVTISDMGSTLDEGVALMRRLFDEAQREKPN